jgi:alpha-tubulin suppressor-like RCC1 family protein
MAVTGSITTRFIDEKGLDLGKTLIEKDYLISVYPNLLNQFDTPMLMGWGGNDSGQLGDNTVVKKSSPIQTIAFGANWKQVSCGYDSNVGVKTDGTLWIWGANASYGQLGDNTVTPKSSPVQTIAFGANWKQVSSGYRNTAAIKTDGTLWTWGRGDLGQLGDNTVVSKSSPVQTITIGTNWMQVSAGRRHTAAIKTDGTLWCWGNNQFGQLGDNTATSRSSPVQTVAFGTNWKQVSTGYQITAAIKTDGTFWTWGYNNNGQLGTNTITHRSSPVQTIAFGTNWKQVSCGSFQMAAIKTDGTLWTWGNNASGQLGDNTTTKRSSPVQTIAFGTNWKIADCGIGHAAAIKTDGTLWIWGDNTSGQLGDNTTTNKLSPVQTILYGQNWKSVSCGNKNISLSRSTTFAIKDGDF